MLRRLARQPLVHFLVIGALFFGIDAVRSPSPNAPEQVVNVSASRIDALSKSWEARMMQPPSPEELRDLVEGYVREEILYREAKKLGLDQDDTVIRRRLAQKMEFLSRDLQAVREPDSQVLQAFYEQHAERYREPARLSFRQIYFNPDRRGADAVTSAREALASLRNGKQAVGSMPGDPSMLEHEYRKIGRQEIRKRFGEAFAAKLMSLPPGHWHGPVESPFGVHLVYLERKLEKRQPTLDEVRQRVLRDYMYTEQEKNDKAFYQRLRRDYSVNIETGAPVLMGAQHEGG